MQKILISIFCIAICIQCFSININNKNIKIIRDAYGVPHIYANTDEEVAYGLAWATCEDDFISVQENILTAKGRLAEVKGKDGAIMDFLCSFVGARNSVDKLYDSSFSPKFKNILSAYVKACNKFAEENPDKVWIKDVFPVTEKDMLVGYTLGMALMTNVPAAIMKIADGNMHKFEIFHQQKGSNAFALNSKKTSDGNVYLGINSHQPLEGPYSWYEAHLHSNEGWNILGGTFPGGLTIFHGTTPNLGWAHTVSMADLDDVYKLKMHPTEKNKYYFDGKWLTLEEKYCKMKVKIFWFIKIPVKKKYYQSVYGPTLEKDGNYYALRFPSAFDIRSAEQWYNMNKAQNFDEFKKAIQTHSFAGLNIIYADKDDNIYYVDNGQFPRRNKNYDWWHVLPGDTSATLWNANDYYSFDSLFQIHNPTCGWLHNNNNTPFLCTGKSEGIDRNKHPLKDYYFAFKNNRGIRTNYLFSNSGKLSYEEFKKIKYDKSFMNPAYNYAMSNIEFIMHVDENKYPNIKESIAVLKKWNREADKNNKQATIAVLAVHYVVEKLIENGMFPAVNAKVKEETIVACIEKAQKHLLKHFGKIEIPLGELQKLVRGEKELPLSGMPDVNAAMDIAPHKKGLFKGISGESYIMLIQYTKEGTWIETVQPYGQSNVKGNKHYDDQMELFVNHQTKKMSMDFDAIMKQAEKVYSPN